MGRERASVDNETWISSAREGILRLGLEVPEGALEPLRWVSQELVRWNARVNLTSITDPREVLEKHILDSLVVGAVVRDEDSLLDLGAGAGFPGLVVGIVRGRVPVELVESVGKKVGFMKHAIAQLGLAPRVRAIQATAEGAPEGEGIARASRVVSRAFKGLGRWLTFAKPYVSLGGEVIAMVSTFSEAELDEIGTASGFRCVESRRFVLPFSGAPRGLLRFALSEPGVRSRVRST
jgi:16S rRNA (guanine527-N7)-methyltransferase